LSTSLGHFEHVVSSPAPVHRQPGGADWQWIGAFGLTPIWVHIDGGAVMGSFEPNVQNAAPGIDVRFLSVFVTGA